MFHFRYVLQNDWTVIRYVVWLGEKNNLNEIDTI